MPDGETSLAAGDEILVCSTRAAQARARANFANNYSLTYLATGADMPRGWLMNRLWQGRAS
jgi:hypothetical protein